MAKTPSGWRLEQVDMPLSRRLFFFGVKSTSGEYIVGDGKGVWITRTVTRRSLEERWEKATVALVGGVP